MKKLKSISTFVILMTFFAGIAFTSCGGKKEVKEETVQTEVSEHPADADSSEHPAAADTTEHPKEEGSEHPAKN